MYTCTYLYEQPFKKWIPPNIPSQIVDYIEKRKPKSIADLPQYVQDKLNALIKKAPSLGIQEIYLVGSYADGT